MLTERGEKKKIGEKRGKGEKRGGKGEQKGGKLGKKGETKLVGPNKIGEKNYISG